MGCSPLPLPIGSNRVHSMYFDAEPLFVPSPISFRSYSTSDLRKSLEILAKHLEYGLQLHGMCSVPHAYRREWRPRHVLRCTTIVSTISVLLVLRFHPKPQEIARSMQNMLSGRKEQEHVEFRNGKWACAE